MSEWKEYKLGDIATFGNGKVRPNSKGNIPIYGGNGILGYCDKFNYSGETIIVGRVGAYCGSVYYENRPIWVSDNALALKTKHNYETKYVYYLLKKYNLNEYAEGSSHPLVTQTLLNSIEVIFTDNVEEQKRITSILSSLDDKIDLLHRENATLEAMAETLFRHWFIEEAKDIEVCLGDVIKTTSGGTPSRQVEKYYCNGNAHWVKSKELHHSYILETEEKITEEAISNSSAKILPENTVLIAMYGATVGEYAIIAEPMTCNQAICALIPNENYPYTYLYIWAKFMQEEFINLACGAAQQNISQELIKKQVVSRDLYLIKEYHKKMQSSFDKMKLNQKEIKNLILLRDNLIKSLFESKYE